MLLFRQNGRLPFMLKQGDYTFIQRDNFTGLEESFLKIWVISWQK